MEPTFDAIVIGGGPAGSGVATYLAREGRRVVLLERARFPREHIGESLLPGVLPYLDALGVRGEIEAAGFERKEGQTFVWGRDRTPWEVDFRELDVHPYAYFVDRARFDDLLLRHAGRVGVDVREECSVSRVRFAEGRAVGVTYRDAGGHEHDLDARFVVDATGQSALVARGAGLRRNVRGLKNVALWSYWENARRMDGHKRAHILTTSIDDGWIWVIPLGDRTSVGVVTSAATQASRDAAGSEAWYEKTLRASEPVWELLDGARRSAPVRAARDWSYRSRRFSGPGIFLAGDAACFIDPILSTGVHLAMSSAYWAAACIHSALDEPKIERFLREFYDQTYGAMYRELLTQVKAFYRAEGRRDSIYWASKKVLRVGAALPGDLAFLFVTAGLLRNAATEAPHEALTQAKRELGDRVGDARPSELLRLGDGSPRARSRAVSPPLVWRIGTSSRMQLVTLRADGLRLSLTRHEPRGLHDRPAKSYFVLDLVDATDLPFGLALIEERHADKASRARVEMMPYPARPADAVLLAEVEAKLSLLVATADESTSPLRLARVRARVRRAVRAGELPKGITIAKTRQHRGGGVGEPAMTAVFDVQTDTGATSVYLVVEARIPAELTDIPVLRTRFLDLWLRPERTREGIRLAGVPSIAQFVDAASKALWVALQSPTSRSAAFAIAETTIQSLSCEGSTLRAIGRLGS